MDSKGHTPDRNVQAQTVGKNLRNLRKRVGLTQTDVAQKAGLSRATIASIERGRYQSTELSTMNAIARALHVDPSLLFADSPDENPHLRAFCASPWFTAAAPTAEELAWLNSIPPGLFADMSPDLLAELLILRRHHLHDHGRSGPSKM